MLDPRHLVYGTTYVYSTSECAFVCVLTHVYIQVHPGDVPIFHATSRMHHLRDILRRYRCGTCSGVHPFSRYLFMSTLATDSKASSTPYEVRKQPARAVTVYDNYYNSAISVPLFLFFLSFDVACPCREPRLAQSWSREVVFLSWVELVK